MSANEAAARAAAALVRAYREQENWIAPGDLPHVGIFGNGMSESLVAAAGALPVHLALGTIEAHHPIESIIEPFVDEEVQHFLIKLMRGDFAQLAGIIFARDDAPALIAYQYATEWIRQEREHGAVPPLFLWNLVHTDSAPVAAFNAKQAEKLFAFFEAIRLERPTADTIAAAEADEAKRRAALSALEQTIGTTRSGNTAAIWRNAGRFMHAAEHAELLTSALADQSDAPQGAERIGIVGSPLSCSATYALIEGFGPIVADLQNFGAFWPGPAPTEPDLDAILLATARDASCHRINPSSAFRAGLVDKLAAAECTLVICQLAQTDDTFGWEMPALFSALAARGITCVNLEFRDARPGAPWLAAAKETIRSALEARS